MNDPTTQSLIPQIKILLAMHPHPEVYGDIFSTLKSADAHLVQELFELLLEEVRQVFSMHKKTRPEEDPLKVMKTMIQQQKRLSWTELEKKDLDNSQDILKDLLHSLSS